VQLVEAKTLQLQQLHQSSSQQVKSLQERIEQDEMTVAGLRRSLDDKEQQLMASNQSYNDVSMSMYLHTVICKKMRHFVYDYKDDDDGDNDNDM